MGDLNRTRASFLTYLALLFVMAVLVAYMIGPYFIAVFMGALLAILSDPVYRALRRRGLGPKLSAGVVTTGLILLVVGPISTLAALAFKQAAEFSTYLMSQEGFSFHHLIQKISRWGPIDAFAENAETLERQVRQALQRLTASLGPGLAGILARIPNTGLQIALTALTVFFLLIDGKRFMSWAGPKITLDPDVRGRLVKAFHETTISVIWANLAAATTQSAIIAAGYLILGIPGAVLAAGATFVFVWIPIVGSLPASAVGIIYLLMSGSTMKTLAMVAIAVFTAVIDNFIRPLVLRGRGEMHPLVSLVAIFGAIQLFGLFGVFIGPIVAALVIVLLNLWPTVCRRSGIGLEDNGVVPQTPAPKPDQARRTA